MAYVTGAPLRYLSETLCHYSISWYVYLEQMIGHLGWVDTQLPWWFWTAFAVLLVLVALIDSEPGFELCLRQRIVSLCTTIVGILSVTTAIYICCNPLRGDVVRYIQGRYFIPFLTAALLGFYNSKLLWTLRPFSIKPLTIRWYVDIVLITWSIFSIVFTLTILLQLYYG